MFLLSVSDDFSFFAVVSLLGTSCFDDLIMKMAREIPAKPKFIVTKWRKGEVPPETLLFTSESCQFLPEILKKRWQTQDLASMMREFKRSAATHGFRRPFASSDIIPDISITDNLSSLVKFKREEQ